MSILKVCPNCKGTGKLYSKSQHGRMHTMYHIICNKCHMRGPVCHDPEEAIQAWNNLHLIGKPKWVKYDGSKETYPTQSGYYIIRRNNRIISMTLTEWYGVVDNQVLEHPMQIDDYWMRIPTTENQ